MKPAKGPGTWFIIIGYTVVALTITFNYISRQSETRAQRLISNGEEEAPVAFPETDALKRQLDEQRQVNREMAKMIEHMQSSLSGTQIQEITRKTISGDPNGDDLPDLNIRSEEASFPIARSQGPRNPFQSFYSGDSAGGIPQAAVRRERFTLKLDPKIPVFLRGGDGGVLYREGP